MNFQENKKQVSIPLSVFIIENFILLYLCIFAALTLLTHLAQLLTLTFRVYSYLSLIVSATALFACVHYVYRKFNKSLEKDYPVVFGIMVLGVFCTFISVFYHRIGRISPDEFYYAANPVYFLGNPNAKMGFQIHTFYSKEPFFSIAYLTAGAFEYIQAVLAFFLDTRFTTVYYLIGAGLTGFMICVSYFLLIHWFVVDSKWALLGTFGVVFSILLMGEKSWVPGAYSFMRAFEGKSFLLFVGIPLFSYFSLQFFDMATSERLFVLFVLSTALVGMSTSSIPIIPLLGCVLFLSSSLSAWKLHYSLRKIFARGFMYFSSFSYLVLYGICIHAFDDARAAAYFNKEYAYSFLGYLEGFIHYPFPTTVIFFVMFSILALFLIEQGKRIFLALWMALAVAFVLNPLAGSFLSTYFTGIYFRFFYIFPFPLVVGLVIAFVGPFLRRTFPGLVNLYLIFIIALFLYLLIGLPTSIFRMGNYDFGNVLDDPDFLLAGAIVKSTPTGVMLAPYPLSGAIQMVDGRFPQLIQRQDIISYYLIVHEALDGDLRLRAGEFSAGKNDDFEALLQIAKNYPELRSIVINRRTYLRFQSQIEGSLHEMGFDFRKIPMRDVDFEGLKVPGIVLFAR